MADTPNNLERLGHLRQHLEVELSEHDVERLVRGGAERRQQRRIRRTLGTGLVLGAVGALAVVLLLRWPTGNHASAGAQPSSSSNAVSTAGTSSGTRAPEVVALGDQSRAIALEPGTRLAVEEDSAEHVHLRLDRGRARFEVTRRPERSFSVRAGNVTVSVIGTTFGVELVADRVGVSVEKGSVEVDWGVGRKRLLAGESGWFPPLVLSGVPETAPPEPGSAPARPAAASAGGTARPAPSKAQELLSDVDRARSRGQPARAAEILRQILREYPDDPRAPLAAFTLGRVLLNELGRPREAAATFRDLRKKAPAGGFAEDALAREVEAWSRAAEPQRARELATAYLEQYPAGRHARRVRALAGLE
jgi:transmembrane sensor